MKNSSAYYFAIDAMIEVAPERDRETLIEALQILCDDRRHALWGEAQREKGKREADVKAVKSA